MRISRFGRVTRATAVLCGLVALLLAGCASALPIVARAPGEGVQVEASSRAITAQNVGQLEEERRQVASIGKVLAVRFAPGGHILSSLGADRVSRRWDADTGRLLEEVYEHYGPGLGLAYSPDGSVLITGGSAIGQDIRMVDVQRDADIATTSTDGYFVQDVTWSPDGERFVVVSSGSSRIYIYNADGTSLRQTRVSGIPLETADHAVDYLAVGNSFGSIYVYNYSDATSYRFVREFQSEDYEIPVRDVRFSADESLLAACYLDGRVHVWEAGSWEPVSTFTAHEFAPPDVDGCIDAAFTPDGEIYFSAGGDGKLVASDPATGERLAALAFDIPVRAVDVSDDGAMVVVGLEDGSLRMLTIPQP